MPLTITKRRKSVDYEAKAVTPAGRATKYGKGLSRPTGRQ
jgi:hypothetical protein